MYRHFLVRSGQGRMTCANSSVSRWRRELQTPLLLAQGTRDVVKRSLHARLTRNAIYWSIHKLVKRGVRVRISKSSHLACSQEGLQFHERFLASFQAEAFCLVRALKTLSAVFCRARQLLRRRAQQSHKSFQRPNINSATRSAGMKCLELLRICFIISCLLASVQG